METPSGGPTADAPGRRPAIDRPAIDRRRRARALLAGLVGTFAVVRVALHLSPDADFTVGAYNVHHLFSGVLLVTVCGIPLALGAAASRAGEMLAFGFGAGLSLALDEWVYLIATDGSNASYLLPVSVVGGVVMIAIAVVYVIILMRRPAARRLNSGGDGTT